MANASETRFACDAMLGSLARWLRAAGYDAFWLEGIDDWDLIRLAKREQRILISCDTGIFRIGIIRDGDITSLQLANGLSTEEQLERVLKHFKLPVRKARCMACGGELVEVPKEQMKDRIPPKSYHWAERFWECQQCGKPFWRGTHWERISTVLKGLEGE